MDFSDALCAMRLGSGAKRPTFGNRQSRFSVKINASGTGFVAVATSGAEAPYDLTDADVLATDWQVV